MNLVFNDLSTNVIEVVKLDETNVDGARMLMAKYGYSRFVPLWQTPNSVSAMARFEIRKIEPGRRNIAVTRSVPASGWYSLVTALVSKKNLFNQYSPRAAMTASAIDPLIVDSPARTSSSVGMWSNPATLARAYATNL